MRVIAGLFIALVWISAKVYLEQKNDPIIKHNQSQKNDYILIFLMTVGILTILYMTADLIKQII